MIIQVSTVNLSNVKSEMDLPACLPKNHKQVSRKKMECSPYKSISTQKRWNVSCRNFDSGQSEVDVLFPFSFSSSFFSFFFVKSWARCVDLNEALAESFTNSPACRRNARPMCAHTRSWWSPVLGGLVGESLVERVRRRLFIVDLLMASWSGKRTCNNTSTT